MAKKTKWLCDACGLKNSCTSKLQECRISAAITADLCKRCVRRLELSDRDPDPKLTVRTDRPPEGRMREIPTGHSNMFTTTAVDHARARRGGGS